MRVYEAIAHALEECGVDTLFGLIGDANLYFAHSFDERGGRYIPVVHEASALLAAAGFASVTGRPGVATVTHGPGLTNAVTSLYEVVKHRVPTVLIVGDTAMDDSDNFQDIDQRALVRATGAMLIETRSPAHAGADVARALRLAVHKRMPVVVSIPIDFQWVEVASPTRCEVDLVRDPVHPFVDRVENAVGVMSSARRPLILAGYGALGAREELVELAERWGALVSTTARARQLFRGVPGDIGFFGGLASPAGLSAIGDADVVVAFGASLNRWTTSDGALLNGKVLIQVDDDAHRIGLHHRPHAAVVGDAGLTARMMLKLLDEAEMPPTAFSRQVFAREHMADAAGEAQEESAGVVDIEHALRRIDEQFPVSRNLVIDAGRVCITALRVMSVEDPAAYVHTINLAAIGVGLPYAIGAAVGAPSRRTLLVCGDGGFMLGGLTELSTAVSLGLDITIAVINDGAYGAEHVQLVRKNLDPSIAMLATPDLAPVAGALGAAGRVAHTMAELDAALGDVVGHAGVSLLDIRVSAADLSARG